MPFQDGAAVAFLDESRRLPEEFVFGFGPTGWLALSRTTFLDNTIAPAGTVSETWFDPPVAGD